MIGWKSIDWAVGMCLVAFGLSGCWVPATDKEELGEISQDWRRCEPVVPIVECVTEVDPCDPDRHTHGNGPDQGQGHHSHGQGHGYGHDCEK